MKYSTTVIIAASLLQFTSCVPIEPLERSGLQLRSVELGLEKRDVVGSRGVEHDLLVRSDLPILDEILRALKDSGLANFIIEFVLSNPTLLHFSTEITISLLRSNQIQLTSVLISLEKSGLIISFLDLALSDPEIVVGLLRIGKELLKQFGFTLPAKNDAVSPSNNGADAKKRDSVATSTPSSSPSAGNDDDLLTQILQSLNDSGLAMAVIENLLTNPNLSEPAAIFLADIIKSGALSLSNILTAVKESNIVFNLLRDILNNRDSLGKFQQLVEGKISNGSISQELYDSL